MSAIAKPMIHSTTDGGKHPIPAELVVRFTKLEVPPRTRDGGENTRWEIIFEINRAGSVGPNYDKWTYSTEALLDADMLLIQNTLSDAIA